MALGGARAMATYVQSDGMRHTFVSDVVSTSACVQLVACPGAAHAKNRARIVVKRCHLIGFMAVMRDNTLQANKIAPSERKWSCKHSATGRGDPYQEDSRAFFIATV